MVITQKASQWLAGYLLSPCRYHPGLAKRSRLRSLPYLIIAREPHPLYVISMADSKTIDSFVSTDEEVEVDADTAAAIERGIRAADEGRVVSSEEVRKRIPQWISKFSTPNRP